MAAVQAILDTLRDDGGPEPPVDVWDPGSPGMVAEDRSGRPVGVACVRPNMVHPAFLRLAIAVVPPARGRGLGRALLTALEEDLAPRVGLQTWAWPTGAAAQRLLGGAGFRPVRRTLTPQIDPRRDALDVRAVPVRRSEDRVAALGDVAPDASSRRALALLAHAVYARAHRPDPVAALPAAFWERAVFADDVDRRASLVLLDALGPAALALAHRDSGSSGLELGWRGVAERRRADARAIVVGLSAAQLVHARTLGAERLRMEVDDWDTAAMAALDALRFPQVAALVTWRRAGSRPQATASRGPETKEPA